MSLLEQSRAAQKNAGNLTEDLRGTYGLGGLGSLLGVRGVFQEKKGSPALRRHLGHE